MNGPEAAPLGDERGANGNVAPTAAWSVAMMAITALALGLRLHDLARQSVWWDEGWSVALARMPVGQMIESTAHDVHPPLYYLALRGWCLVCGESEFALRFLSLWFGVASVSLAYRLGCEVLSRPAGLLTAMLVAVSPFCVAWSQETRMYVLATALGLASTWLALRLWREGRGFWAYCLASSTLLYTLYVGIVFILVQNLTWLALLSARRRRYWRRWVIAQVTVAAGVCPWLVFALARTRTWSVAEPIGFGRLILYYWAALITSTSAYVEDHAVLLALLAVCLIVAVTWLARGRWGQDWWRPVLLLAGALAPPLVVFVMSQPRDFLYSPRPEPRYLNPFAPLVYLLWACGIAVAWRQRRWQPMAMAALAAGGMVASLPDYYAGRTHTDDYESMACTLTTYVQAGDLVLLHTDHDWPVFAYHYAGDYVGVPNAVYWDTASAASFATTQTNGRSTVWLAITTDAIRVDAGMVMEQSVRQWCGDDCRTNEWRFGERRLVRLSRTGALPAPSLLAAGSLPGHAGILGGWWAGTELSLGDEWRAYLWWNGEGVAPVLLATDGAGAGVVLAPSVEVGVDSTVARLAYAYVPAEAGDYRISLQHGGEWPLARLSVSSGGTQAGAFGATALVGATTPGGAKVPVGAAFAGGVRLDAYTVDGGAPTPGDGLCVTLEWQASAALGEAYAVFVHLLGSEYNARSGNFLWGQHDGQPVDGTRPLTGWRPGETIVDRHCFTVDTSAPQGTYLLEVGLYDRSSGTRLPLESGGDAVLVGSVEVRSR